MVIFRYINIEHYVKMSCLFNIFYKTNKIYAISFASSETKYCEEECAICLDLLNSSLTMPCGHTYHSNCIMDWLNYHMDCPICRQEFKWGGRGHKRCLMLA